MVELAIMVIVGIALIYNGYLIWQKEKISIIHPFHYTKVRDEDKAAYTALVGKGVLLMGVGAILTGGINYMFRTTYGWAAFGIFFVIGIIFIWLGQKRYNAGFF
ncbi:MAG: hypothetical protein ATN34_04880 [Epulopiscium sp. Nele67-Bin002]|nr:MAG: hypothetical protein ATN34_04880 [Epulopiscium sp. Nele67-Bin002]